MLTGTPDDVRFAYRLLLGREPDPDGARLFCELLRESSLSTRELASLILNSPEYLELQLNNAMDVAGASSGRISSETELSSSACTKADLESQCFRDWALRMRERSGHIHRKLWEWCFIAQGLNERGMLGNGSRGLGFAIGREPLVSLFASMGCRILGTDLDFARAKREGWVDGNQHAKNLDLLNERGLCDPEIFASQVDFRVVDMRKIPTDIGTFDFLWSSCAMEHLGGLREGLDFVLNAMNHLRPGGVAVHTTEYNCDSDDETVFSGNSVIYRKRDLIELSTDLENAGHFCVPFDFATGKSDADLHVEEPPYTGQTIVKLRIGPFASTSFGLIIVAGSKEDITCRT